MTKYFSQWLLLLLLSVANFTFGCLTYGLVTVVLTTIERRFGFSSTQSGLIVSLAEVGQVLSLIPVTIYGGQVGANKTKGRVQYIIDCKLMD